MISTHHTRKRLFIGIAVAALVAALTASSALAQPDTWFKNAVSSSASGGNAKFVTDTLAPGGGSTQAQGYRFVTDTLAPGGGVVAVSPGVQGFDWTDAAIGAGGTVGLVLILLGGTRLMSQRRGALAV